MRLIDADALKEDLKLPEESGRMGKLLGIVIDAVIEDAPTIEERKKGKWIDYSDEGYVECPFCHSATNCDDNIKELHFCFSCGADMREQP